MNEPSERELAVEVATLRERVEDARELDAGIQRNSGSLLIPWEQARRNWDRIGIARPKRRSPPHPTARYNDALRGKARHGFQ